MRPDVRAFIADGPLPDEDNAEEEDLDRRYEQIRAIAPPVTAEEAQALAACFGPDDCYGVAWTLLHLIETSPEPMPALAEPGPEVDEYAWPRIVWRRWGGGDD